MQNDIGKAYETSKYTHVLCEWMDVAGQGMLRWMKVGWSRCAATLLVVGSGR